MLGNVKLRLKVQLGQTRMLVEEVLKLDDGSVVELDKLAGDPVDPPIQTEPPSRPSSATIEKNPTTEQMSPIFEVGDSVDQFLEELYGFKSRQGTQ